MNLRNRTPDKNLEGERSDPADKSHLAAYAASTSGHFFYIVALVEGYMKTYAGSPSLESDINNYIKAIIVNYVNQGYHSYLEMQEVFTEPHIKAIFDSHHVIVDLGWSRDAIEQATRDTQEYTKTICLKKSLSAELKSMVDNVGGPAGQARVNAIAIAKLKEQFEEINKELSHYLNKQGFFNKRITGKEKIISDAKYDLRFLENAVHFDYNPNIAEINR